MLPDLYFALQEATENSLLSENRTRRILPACVKSSGSNLFYVIMFITNGRAAVAVRGSFVAHF